MIKFTSKIKNLIFILYIFNFLLISSYNVDAVDVDDNKPETLYKETINSAAVFNCNEEQIYISDDDIYLMAQVVYGESRAEPYEGKVAVASVILNRIIDKSFPMSVEGVVKQKGAFSCINNGKINVTPTKECYSAVYDALKGKDPTDEALFFYNPKIATCKWMKTVHKKDVKTIGNHVFFVAQ